MLIIAAALAVLTGCQVTDGDTIKCQGERIRLIGIDAPEMPGHCRRGRACVPGDPYASRDSLERAIAARRLTIERLGTDRYGRTLAVVWAGPVNLSCAQLKVRAAAYVSGYDRGGRVARCKTGP